MKATFSLNIFGWLDYKNIEFIRHKKEERLFDVPPSPSLN